MRHCPASLAGRKTDRRDRYAEEQAGRPGLRFEKYAEAKEGRFPLMKALLPELGFGK